MVNDVYNDIQVLDQRAFRHAYFDRSCRFCQTLFNIRSFPRSMCVYNRLFCLGKYCDSFVLKVQYRKKEYIQLSLDLCV